MDVWGKGNNKTRTGGTGDGKMAQQFQIGDRVVDRDGFRGTIAAVTHHDGSHWYDVRLARGEAVRYDYDLTLIGSGK